MKSDGWIPWNAIAICEMFKTSWQTGNMKINEDLGNHLKDQFYHLTHWLDTSQNPKKDRARIDQFGKKVLPRIFPGQSWDEDILTAEIEELEKLGASEKNLRRLNAKEVLITHKDGEFVFPVADVSAKLSERDYEVL